MIRIMSEEGGPGQDFNSYVLADGRAVFASDISVDGDISVGGDISVDGGMTIDGSLLPTEDTTTGSQTLSPGSSWIIPRGIYSFIGPNVSSYDLDVEVYINSAWGAIGTLRYTVTTQVISDGSNYRVHNDSDDESFTFYWRKH